MSHLSKSSQGTEKQLFKWVPLFFWCCKHVYITSLLLLPRALQYLLMLILCSLQLIKLVEPDEPKDLPALPNGNDVAAQDSDDDDEWKVNIVNTSSLPFTSGTFIEYTKLANALEPR